MSEIFSVVTKILTQMQSTKSIPPKG